LGTDANQRSVVSARITGRVQGVWYRGWTQEEAIKRQLDGWVRNRQDGSVEALFSGTSAQVTEMIEACRTGPPMARVDDVQVTAVESDSVAVGQGFDTLGSN
jgi:acylphosphatase